MPVIVKQLIYEKILKLIEKNQDNVSEQYYSSLSHFNPSDSNILLGKMIAYTEIRKEIISELLKEVK